MEKLIKRKKDVKEIYVKENVTYCQCNLCTVPEAAIEVNSTELNENEGHRMEKREIACLY